MMQLIAHGIASGNLVAYMILYIILLPPIMLICFAIIDWIKNKNK